MSNQENAPALEISAGKPMKRYVGVKETMLYGLANGGQVFGYNLVTTYLSFFYVTVFGIDPIAVSLMILITGIWDTVNDPVMGSFIDKTRSRYGKLRPYLMLVPLPLCIAICLLFSGPVIMQNVGSMALKIVYMIISYLIWEMLYTIGDVPFWAMSSTISPNPQDRTRVISSARLISSIIGVIATMGASIFIDLSNNHIISLSLPEVFMVLGLVAGIGGMALFALAGFKTKERLVQTEQPQKLGENLKLLFKNKPLFLLILMYLLKVFARVTTVFGNYYYISVLGFGSLSILAGIPGFISGMLIYAFIPKLKRRFNGKQMLIVGNIIRTAVIATSFFIGLSHFTDAMWIVPIMAVQSFIVNMLDGIDMVIPTEMIGDTVDYMELKTGNRNEGMSFSALTFVGKFTGSVSAAIGTAMLPVIGFVVGSNGAVIKGEHTDFWLWAFFTIIPAVLGLAQIIPLFFYKLVGKNRDKMLAELAEKRAVLVAKESESAKAHAVASQEEVK